MFLPSAGGPFLRESEAPTPVHMYAVKAILARVACRSWRNEAVVLDKVYGFKPTCRQCSVVDEMPSPPCGAYEFKVESSLPATGMALTSQLPAQLCHVQIVRCCTAYIQCSSRVSLPVDRSALLRRWAPASLLLVFKMTPIASATDFCKVP